MSILMDALQKAADEKSHVDSVCETQELFLEVPLDFHCDVEEVPVQKAEQFETIEDEPDLADGIFDTHAQKKLTSKRPEQKKYLAYYLLIMVFLLLLIGVGWSAYEPFISPGAVAHIGSLPERNIEEPLMVPAIHSVKEQVATAPEPKSSPKPLARAALPQTKEKITIVRNTQRDSLSDNLQTGFREYQQGNYASSSIAYRRALQQDEKNRDALLGLAANNMRRAQSDKAYLVQAKKYYSELLNLDPLDAAARAGLVATSESISQENSLASLKEAIQQRPQTAPLHYSLANAYASKGYWSQAQAAYFKAFGFAPDNADYAFNLAVSLDHLGQSSSALNYYKKSLSLAASSPNAIDLFALQKRMQYLQEKR